MIATDLPDLRAARIPIEHCFGLTDKKPIYFKTRMYPGLKNDIFKGYSNKMLEVNVIKPFVSPLASPVVIVSKPDRSSTFLLIICS